MNKQAFNRCVDVCVGRPIGTDISLQYVDDSFRDHAFKCVAQTIKVRSLFAEAGRTPALLAVPEAERRAILAMHIAQSYYPASPFGRNESIAGPMDDARALVDIYLDAQARLKENQKFVQRIANALGRY